LIINAYASIFLIVQLSQLASTFKHKNFNKL
jgi:hypothetical protein